MRSLVLLAGGTGSRLGLGYNKIMYRFKNNKTILQTTLDIFYNINIFDEFIIVYNKEDIKTIQQDLREYKNIKLIEGEGKRYENVNKGVLSCKNKIVYIHDGARLNFNSEYIYEIEEEVKNGYSCITLGVPPKDTIAVKKNNIISNNLKRDNLISIQTPQVINKEVYLNIYEGEEHTDESSLFFKNNIEVKVVIGDYSNFKITTVEDLKLYECLYYKDERGV